MVDGETGKEGPGKQKRGFSLSLSVCLSACRIDRGDLENGVDGVLDWRSIAERCRIRG